MGKTIFCSRICMGLANRGSKHPRYTEDVKHICLYCKNNFMTKNYLIKKGYGKYCNKECFDNAQRGRKFAQRSNIACKQCGNIFKVKTSQLKYNPNHNQFCSRKCRYNNQKKPKIHRICEQCKKNFLAYPSAIKYHGARFCSNNCKDTYNRAEHHFRFKNASSEAEKLRKSPAYKTWRTAVFIRDDKKCVWCGSKKNIEADHIKPRYLFPELTLELSNGRTLCNTCHRKTRSYMNAYLKREDYAVLDNLL